MGITSTLECELKAVQLGLHLTNDRGYRRIILQVDNKEVYQAINMNITVNISSKNMLDNVKWMLNIDWGIRVFHITWRLIKLQMRQPILILIMTRELYYMIDVPWRWLQHICLTCQGKFLIELFMCSAFGFWAFNPPFYKKKERKKLKINNKKCNSKGI